MPIKQAGKKAMRSDKRKAARNKRVKSELKTLGKKAVGTISANNKDAAQSSVKEFAKALDMAASKGIIHKNTAARKKSRTMKKLHKLSAA